jgi:hypothetical protein
MKAWVLFFILIAILAGYPFFNRTENNEKVTGLPWQIEIAPDGSTTVFGIRPGHSRLADVRAIMGDDMELAIIAASDEGGALEMYYGHYRAGLLSGKLILQAGSDAQILETWRSNAVSSEYMPTGQAKKYIPSADDLPQILDQKVTGLTFIPAINLDEAVILARFGVPAERIQKAGVEHFLYPEKGLDIALHEDSKEVLQYVSPDTFLRLVEPLQNPSQ